jgi:hypothetical protein
MSREEAAWEWQLQGAMWKVKAIERINCCRIIQERLGVWLSWQDKSLCVEKGSVHSPNSLENHVIKILQGKHSLLLRGGGEGFPWLCLFRVHVLLVFFGSFWKSLFRHPYWSFLLPLDSLVFTQPFFKDMHMASHHFYLHLTSKWPFSGTSQVTVSFSPIGCLWIPLQTLTFLSRLGLTYMDCTGTCLSD